MGQKPGISGHDGAPISQAQEIHASAVLVNRLHDRHIAHLHAALGC